LKKCPEGILLEISYTANLLCVYFSVPNFITIIASNHQIVGDKKALDFPLVVDFLLKLILGHYLVNLPLSHIFSSNHRVLHFSPSPKAAQLSPSLPTCPRQKRCFVKIEL
jgi:hypothetical protein